MAKMLVFDTNICGPIAKSVNRDQIMAALKQRYVLGASANTIHELVRGFCSNNNDAYLGSDKERLKVALGSGAAGKALYLDHGLPFAIRIATGITIPENGKAEKYFKAFANIILQATDHREMKVLGVGSERRVLKCDVILGDFDEKADEAESPISTDYHVGRIIEQGRAFSVEPGGIEGTLNTGYFCGASRDSSHQ